MNTTENGTAFNLNGWAELGGYRSDFYATATKNTIAHEFGHNPKLMHTFEAPYGVPKYNNKNIMDYHDIGNPYDPYYLKHQLLNHRSIWYLNFVL